MRRCHGCGAQLRNFDEYVCRVCVKSPAVQMRVHLSRARAFGMVFERAWGWAWERVVWPHDTTHRREWKKILGQEKGKIVWRAAFELNEPTDRDRYLAQLELVA